MCSPSKSNSIKEIFGNILDCTPLSFFFYTQAKVGLLSQFSWYMEEYSSTHRDPLSLICPLFPEPLRFWVQRLSSSCMTNVAGYWEKGWQQRSCKIEKLKMKTAASLYLLWGVGCVVNHMTCRLWILLHISSQTVIPDLYPRARISVQPNNIICMQQLSCTNMVSCAPDRPLWPCHSGLSGIVNKLKCIYSVFKVNLSL